MTTILTEIGWENENGNLLGTWTNRADLVDEGDEITVAPGVIVNSLAENDEIAGTGFTGIANRGTINTGFGNDTINATGTTGPGIINIGGIIDTGVGNDIITATGGDGIDNGGTINTGLGSDTITATGKIGIVNGGTLDTGFGNDIITGTATDNFGISNGDTINTGFGDDIITGNGISIGIVNTGTLDTSFGNDKISGIATDGTGIDNGEYINTGAGNDTIIGSGGVGIFNSGTIDTSAGNDTVDALTGGFDSFTLTVGTIDLGKGDDLIRGFGNQVVDGGQGFDTAELGIDYNQITLSNALGSSINIAYDSATMAFTNVELFVFGDETFTLQQLQEQATI